MENHKHYCPKCKKETEFKYYDGALGYESFVCSICNFDIQEVTISDLDDLYTSYKIVKEK